MKPGDLIAKSETSIFPVYMYPSQRLGFVDREIAHFEWGIVVAVVRFRRPVSLGFTASLSALLVIDSTSGRMGWIYDNDVCVVVP